MAGFLFEQRRSEWVLSFFLRVYSGALFDSATFFLHGQEGQVKEENEGPIEEVGVLIVDKSDRWFFGLRIPLRL
jgi:hypothetical protein